ncbi:MAG: AAA family ATPase [Spirochaetota bacterium]|jgi:DNA polymerase III delta prime subunit|nr:AAA family ATPase [Spirochaetota bacterium]
MCIKSKEQIIVKGEDKTDSIRSWNENGERIDITYLNGKTYSYSKNNVRIERSPAFSDTLPDRFGYFKQIAQTIGLKDTEGNNILENRYNKINLSDVKSILTVFIDGKLHKEEQTNDSVNVYPFGFNISQKAAVDKAFKNPLTIIEGPPGTGKTLTILNIIANAVMRGKSIAVVSNNNSATKNIQEKLNTQHIDFIAAYLGNSDNKKKFIESQMSLPDMGSWKLSEKQKQILYKLLKNLCTALHIMLAEKNKAALIQRELDVIEVEYRHFCAYYTHTDELPLRCLKPVSTSAAALKLWYVCEKYAEREEKPFGWLLNRLIYRAINKYLHGIINKAFYDDTEIMIAVCQNNWYQKRIVELKADISAIHTELDRYNFNEKINEYTGLSMQLFRAYLAEKYKDGSRQKFELEDLWKNPVMVIREYPVILSTTYSLSSSLSHKVMYDYVIIDEASQVDIATGALALSCAKRVVVAGDLKQLPNVVNAKTAHETDAIFEQFDLPEAYRYKNNSILSALLKQFPDVPYTFLREHYRCHPKIIGFCNQKFYNNRLIVFTETKSDRDPLMVYKTIPGNHARGRHNQRQIDMIKDEIIPQQNLTDGNVSIGIVTPYRDQTHALQAAFAETSIQADTVDKFQGREKDVIILSTVDNKISGFADNANRLNVAISRAIKQLIVVVHGNDDMRNTNTGDLVRYVEYNNPAIVHSEICSVFDYLYKNYREKRIELLRNKMKISEYDSENLMYGLICGVLRDERFTHLDCVAHIPLKRIIPDVERLNAEERLYAENIMTHVDFLVFDKIGKLPRLVIEVDGIAYHAQGTRQAVRDKLKNSILEKNALPYLRFRTDGSGERERLIAALEEL